MLQVVDDCKVALSLENQYTRSNASRNNIDTAGHQSHVRYKRHYAETSGHCICNISYVQLVVMMKAIGEC